MSEAGRYARLHAIFDAARRLDPPARHDLVEQKCGGDEALRDDVLKLLAAAEAGQTSDAFSEARIAAARASLEALADAGSAEQAWLPERIAGYRITRRLGEGGMGVVYEALQESPRRRVAVKLLHPMHTTAERLKRFRQEAELLGRLQHPGIAQIFEAGTYDLGRGAQPFFAMEHVEGLDLRAHCDRAGLGTRARLELLARVCDAVHYAHEKGVIHRDLKPDNILVNEHGQPKVLDFGIARAGETSTSFSTIVTQTGQLVGTLAYMAPEQLSRADDAITPRVDVYALGVIGFELLTGRLPHVIGDLSLSQAVALLSATDAPRAGSIAPGLRGDVETILGAALDSDVERRYASPAALAGDIRRYLANEPIRARPPSRIYRARKFTRRHRTLVGGVAATILTLLAGTAVALVLAKGERTQRRVADERTVEARRNEATSIGALLQSAQALIGRDLVWEARNQHQNVPEHARDWTWHLLNRSLPRVISEPRTSIHDAPWDFIDADRLCRHAPSRDLTEIYDLIEGRKREVFAGAGFATMTAATPDGVALAWREGEHLLVDLLQERVLQRWPAPSPSLPAALSSDGRTIARMLDPAVLEIMVDREVRHTLTEVADVAWLGILSNCRHVVLGRAQGRGELIEIESGRSVFTWPHDGPVQQGVPGGLGQPLFLPWATGGRNVVRVEVTEDETIVHDIELAPRHVDDGDRPWDGRFYAQAFGDGVPPMLRDTVTGGPYLASHFQDESGAFPAAAGRRSGVQVAPDGSGLVFTGSYSAPWVVDLDPREAEPGFDPRCITLRGHTSWIYHVAVSNDGSMMASAAPMDPLVRVWDTETGEPVAALERVCHETRSWDVLMTFSSDDERLLLTTPYGAHALAIVDWELASGEIEATPVDPAPGATRHLPLIDQFIDRLDPGPRARLSQRVQMCGSQAIALSTNASGVWDVPSEATHRGGRRWRLAPGDDVLKKGPRGLAVHPHEEQVAVVIGVPLEIEGPHTRPNVGRLVVAAAATGEALVRRPLNYTPWCAAWSPDGGLLAIGTNEGHVVLYETEFYTQRLDLRAHSGGDYFYVHSLAWTPDGTRLVTASGDRTLRIWDARERAVARRAEQQWRALLAEMAERSDLAQSYSSLRGRERAAARIELMKKARDRSSAAGSMDFVITASPR